MHALHSSYIHLCFMSHCTIFNHQTKYHFAYFVIKRGLNPKNDPYISKIERVLVDQKMTKSRNLKIFKSQYLSDFLRYQPDILYVIMHFICLKITFSNMWSHGTLSLISEWVAKMAIPAFS